MYDVVHLVTSKAHHLPPIDAIIEHIQVTYNITPNIVSPSDEIISKREDEIYLLYLSDNETRYFFQANLNSKINIGILPNEEAPDVCKTYAISKNTHTAIDDAFNPNLLTHIDLLQCNEVITFNRIVVGDMHDINIYDFKKKSLIQKVKIFFSNLANIKFKKYTLLTSKEQKIQVAASGITVLERTTVNDKASPTEELSIHNGKLNALILAPTSLISYIWYLLVIFFYQTVKLSSLPKSIGLIKTSKLSISSENAIDFMLDGNWLSSKSIDLLVLGNCLKIHLGKSLEEKINNADLSVDEKDTIKINSLPKGEVNTLLIEQNLPLFKKASDDDFKEIFITLRDSAKFSYIFLVLMVLSTLLATTGLFANSAPVVIGAMILAPLMSPIISLSMGVIRAEKMLLAQSSKTLLIGIGMALLASSLYSFIIPLDQITPEMQSRINPTFLDLMVAVFAGMAGAYASAKEEVAKSLAGVAIAVALVPPLSVTGIGIGIGNLDVIYGSFLLFTTNIVGITLSAAITFIVLGYAPVQRAKRGVIYTSVLMAIIAIPLIFSFKMMIDKNQYLNKLAIYKDIHIQNHEVHTKVKSIKIRNEHIEIELEVISENEFVVKDYKEIKNLIEKTLEQKVKLQIIPKLLIE